jgi:hypothetical protein
MLTSISTAPGKTSATVKMKSDICAAPVSPLRAPTRSIGRWLLASANPAPDALSCVHDSPTSRLPAGITSVSVRR